MTSQEQALLDTLGKNVRVMREDVGWSQEYLAEHAGIEPSYLQKIEKGRTKGMTFQTVAKLARALGVDPLELFSKPA